MRVVYIYGYNPQLPGVMNKVKDMLYHLRLSGAEVIPLLITSKLKDNNELPENAVLVEDEYKNISWLQIGPLKAISYLHKSKTFIRVLEKRLDELKPDIVIVRYRTMNPFIGKLLGKYKFVFEHNTKEIEELEMFYSGIRRSGWEKAIILWLENNIAPRLLRKAAGIIGVTNEITQYELSRAKKAIPALTSGNGIDCSRVQISSGAEYRGGTLHLLMLSAVSVSWQGTDKLINSIKPEDDVHLWLAGSYSEEEKALAQKHTDKITFTGSLKGDELNQLFDKIHLAVASLAIERKGLKEMSALKVREYAARGVPFVSAFEDPDLPQGALPDGIGWLRVSASKGTLDLSTLRNFALTATRAENRKLLREFAERQMSYAGKMQRVFLFLQQLTKRNG